MNCVRKNSLFFRNDCLLPPAFFTSSLWVTRNENENENESLKTVLSPLLFLFVDEKEGRNVHVHVQVSRGRKRTQKTMNKKIDLQ